MLIARALHLIETRLSADLSLAFLADRLGVTPAWLTRAFAMGTGQPLMRYVWRRRLTEAARQLARGHGTVLTVALDAGYASHEAFTRAFRAEFRITPRALLLRGDLDQLALTPAMEITMSDSPALTTPVVTDMPARRIMGPLVRYDMVTRSAIPGQWAAYNEAAVVVPGAVPGVWYGVCANFGADMSFDYLCGMEVPTGPAPAGWQVITLPAGRWARFVSRAHISTIGQAWEEIYRDHMGKPGLIPRDGPSTEVYGDYDPETGEGGYEIWLPVV